MISACFDHPDGGLRGQLQIDQNAIIDGKNGKICDTKRFTHILQHLLNSNDHSITTMINPSEMQLLVTFNGIYYDTFDSKILIEIFY